MSTQEPYPERFDCSSDTEDEGPVGEPDQDGNTDKPKVPKYHSPLGLTTGSMLLTDHSRASVHVYIREDLKKSQRVKYNTFVEAIFGLTPQTQAEWMDIIAKEKWHDDKVISEELEGFCKASTETARYAPLCNVINRIMEMAHGRLPGVPDTYPIADICVKRNDPLYVRPIEAHRGLGAKRKPDLLTLRGRHAVNLRSHKAGATPPTEGPPVPATVPQHPQSKGRVPERDTPTTKTVVPPAGPAPILANAGDSAVDLAEGSAFPDRRGSSEDNRDRDTAFSAGRSPPSPPSPSSPARKRRRASAPGVRWVDDIMNWELKGSSNLSPLLASFKEDRNRSAIPSSEPRPDKEALSSSAASSVRDDASAASDYDDDTASAGMKRRRRQSDLIDCVRLPEPPGSVEENMDSEEREPYDLRAAAIQTGSYALETLASTFGTRLFCVNILFQNDRLYLWYYDACGFVYTDSISLIEDFERAAALFVGVACATPAQLGALPPVIKPPRLARYPENWPPENLKGHTVKIPQTVRRPDGEVARMRDIHLTLQDSVFTQYIVAGRRTFVYTVKTRPDISKGKLIVKLSYQVTRRWKEHELIDKATKAGVGHLPTVHAYGDLWKMSEGVRGVFYKKEKIEYEDRTLRAIIYSKYVPLETLFPTSPESIPLMAYQMIDCEQFIVTVSSCAYYPNFLGLHDLRYKANILHRDISVNNVMYEHRDGRLYFILIDFDMATVVSDDPNVPYKCRSKHRTGTLAFMAVALIQDAARGTSQSPGQKNIAHLLCHDLESIFWLCLWCTLVMVAADSQDQREEFLAIVRAWETKDLWMIASRKKVIKSSELDDEGINLSQAAIDASLDIWFATWSKIWNACNAHLNDYRLDAKLAKPKDKPLPVIDWETVDGRITRDNLRKHLTACIPDPYASSVDLANAEDALPPNASAVLDEAIDIKTTLIAETAPAPNTTDANAIGSRPPMAADGTSEDISPASVGPIDLVAATRAISHIGNSLAAVDTGSERRMRTRASTRLAAAKSSSTAATKSGTEQAKPGAGKAKPSARKAKPGTGRAKAVTRRARSPTREQSAEIAKKANAAAKRTAKKASAAAKKITKKAGTTEKKATKKADTTEKEATKKTGGGNRKTTKQTSPAEKTAKRVAAMTARDSEAENDIRKRLRPRK
ncbi:hypothetical protein NM688_g828 [Phlebia brevispora]|uniref:Uncharacterized protein n=1 Tax=Phlebia brevispora TaxID=194682 RepID=A0ACC1TD86_9APHY|nr:hypothetical protein NM688_g828 [Phlebia brevispora]